MKGKFAAYNTHGDRHFVGKRYFRRNATLSWERNDEWQPKKTAKSSTKSTSPKCLYFGGKQIR